MYLTATDNHYVIDIETDDLDATVVWVVCVRNVKTKQEWTLHDYQEIRDFVNSKPEAIWIGHNILKFDGPTLNRLCGTRIRVNSMVDTLLLSMLYSPSIAGGHSLESWGERLGNPKGEFNDFSHLSQEMIDYCIQDVRLTADIFLRLTHRMRMVGFTEMGAEIEHLAWRVMDKQRQNGFAFDYPRAHQLYVTLRQKEEEIKQLIYHKFPPELQCVKQYKRAYKKDGSPTEAYARHLEEYARIVAREDGGYDAYAYVEFNLGSPAQRVAKLLELGWEPEEFTKPSKTHPNGQPKPTDKGNLSPSLERFADESGIEEVRLIAQWLAINGRANTLNNWMDAYNHETGCLHGNVWLAATLRYKHDKPNTANIPAVRVDGDKRPILGMDGLYTYEARDLWVTRDPVGRNLVGVDAKGIQLRVLAHYLGDDAFTEAILSEDPHTANQQRLGLPTRALTKTIVYATLMGAGDAKIASEAKTSLKEAKAAKKKFFDGVPGLKALTKRLKEELKRTGRITLCDGSKIIVSSPHMVIPYLLQGDESRIMKRAAINVDRLITKEKLDVLKVGDIHDEWQSDASIRDTVRYVGVCEESFAAAGRYFNYTVPIECEAKIGKTWAETH